MKKGSFLLLSGLVFILAALALTCYNFWDSRRAGNASNETLARLESVMQAQNVGTKPNRPSSGEKESTGYTETEPRTGSDGNPESAEESENPGTDAGQPEGQTNPAPSAEAHTASPQLQRPTVQVPLTEIEYPDYTLNPDMDMPVVVLDTVEYMGILTLPTLGMEFPISSEWDYTKLKNVPCRYSGSAYKGNLVICGHNYRSHFGPISRLNYGDEVYFTDLDGNWFRYRVVNAEVLEANAVEEMTTDEYNLTLFTCNLQGNARVTVRCQKMDN